MFIGKYYHTLESKGRVSLPKVFRDTTHEWIVTRGLDGGLFLFTQADFAQEVARLAQRSFTTKRNRDFLRLMTNEAQAVTPDANGRILLPEYLISQAELTKRLVIVGSVSRLEIWDADKYHEYVSQLESQAETLAESLEADE